MSEILNLMMIFIKKKSAQKIHQNNLWKRWKWLILSQLSKHKPRFANWGINDMTMTSLQTFAVSSPQQIGSWVQKKIPAGNMVDHILGQNHSVAPYFRNANWLQRVTSSTPPPPPPPLTSSAQIKKTTFNVWWWLGIWAAVVILPRWKLTWEVWEIWHFIVVMF